jgi:hypothetical protein
MIHGGSHSHRTVRVLAVLVAAAVTIAAPTVARAAPAQAPPTSYVALGDSFTSGPLIPNQSLEPLGCLRSDHNYPHLVAPATGTQAFRDVSCAGADTDNFYSEHGVWPGPPNPPQLNALDTNTRVVTVGMGGNDIDFGGIVENCVSALPFGSPCRDKYVVGGVDQLSGRITATAPKIAAGIDAIRARSPLAKILIVGYPAIVPNSGSGCWPSLPMAWADVPYLRAKTKELNGMIAAQAAAHGAQFVDLYGPSIGKDACASSSVRWVEPLIPANWGAPFHPNDRGHRGMATVIRAAL